MAHTVVSFGAPGDLPSRKLIPALYLLYQKGRLPKDTRVVGVSRTMYTHDAWRKELAETTRKFTGQQFDAAGWQAFAASVFYQPGDIGRLEDFQKLSGWLNELEGAP